MNEKERLIKILDSVQTTISNCDNKAMLFLTAIGLVFGLSSFSTDSLYNKQDSLKIAIIIIGLLYLLTFICSVVLLILVVYPRGKNKKESKNKKYYQCYSEDLYYHLKNGSIDNFANSELCEDAIIDQIKVCTRIAHLKQTLLKISSLFLIAFISFLIALIIIIFV